MRLFPIPYRFLPKEKRFHKYQWIDIAVKKAPNDTRPESHNVQGDSIQIVSEVSTANAWQARKEWLYPIRAHCMCCARKTRDENDAPTLALIKPAVIEKLLIVPDEAQWSQSQLETLRQGDLFAEAPEEELQKIPFTFKYKFRCDHSQCPGHEMSCTDWEMGQSWRSWTVKYGDAWESKFRETYESRMIESPDTHFYVGTIHQYPNAWIIVGLFYPGESSQVGLFF
jgi:hypothetical protein